MTLKPLLASAIENMTDLRYPLLASPKLDGVRCLVHGGVAVSRNLKPIPNRHVQNLIGNSNLEGLDGELIVGNPMEKNVFQATTSGVMSREGTPDFKYYVFDDYTLPDPFQSRFNNVGLRFHNHPHIVVVNHTLIRDAEDLSQLENTYVSMGYEGVMLRDPNGRYKQGRSTLKEGILLKVKRFEDTEGTIVGFVEKLHNENEATINALGHTERSSHKAGMVAAGTLGAIVVRSEMFEKQFQIGSGFNDAQRKEIWENQNLYLYKQVKFKFQPSGVLDLPRFPIFLGFRKD